MWASIAAACDLDREHRHSAVVACGLSFSATCGILLDQGLNLYPLHCKLDSQPLDYQKRPIPLKLLFRKTIKTLLACLIVCMDLLLMRDFVTPWVNHLENNDLLNTVDIFHYAVSVTFIDTTVFIIKVLKY